jgi:hypothetical protein
LEDIKIEGNQLTELDLANNTSLEELNIGGNQLTELDLTNNTSLVTLIIDDMPTLECVLVWELPFPPEGVEVDTTDSPNVVFGKDYCAAAGIEDDSQFGLSIYPNPTSSVLTIETGISGHYSIHVTTMSGQMVFSTEMEGTINQIDLSSFRKGVYVITIRSNDWVTMRKIIKL